MNFLAHAYLSLGHSEILVGNLITDFIRGIHVKNFSSSVQDGIELHHMIDEFTDHHPATIHARSLLYDACGRYCSVFMDVVYDYFLANDKNCFSMEQLRLFSNEVYKTLTAHYNILPEGFKNVFLYMKEQDWLYNYHTKTGIKNAFNGIYRRAIYLQKSDAAYLAFLEHQDQFREVYSQFMPEMIRHTEQFLQQKGYPINNYYTQS